jgi:hypothetical protein
MNIHPVFKNKWFWIGVVVLFVFAIIWDITIASAVLITSVMSGKWSLEILGLGVLYTLTVLYRKHVEWHDRRRLKTFGRLVLFVIAVISFHDYGFWQMLYFLTTVFIFTTFMKWIMGLLNRKKRHKNEPIIISE